MYGHEPEQLRLRQSTVPRAVGFDRVGGASGPRDVAWFAAGLLTLARQLNFIPGLRSFFRRPVFLNLFGSLCSAQILRARNRELKLKTETPKHTTPHTTQTTNLTPTTRTSQHNPPNTIK